MLDAEEEYRELIDALTRFLDEEPDNAIALNNRAVALREIGDRDRAVHDLSDAIRGGCGAVPLVNRGDVLMELAFHSDALRDYTAAIKLEPTNATLRRSRAYALHRLSRFNEAINDYNVAIEIEPEVALTRIDRDKAITGTQLDRP